MRTKEERSAVPGLLVVLLRSLRGWSQAKLARASGVDESQISLYERWQCSPTEETLKRLASAAGVPWPAALKTLPALRWLYRLPGRPPGSPVPGAPGLAAAVGRSSERALNEAVGPYLACRLPGLLPAEGPEPGWSTGGDPGLRLLIALLRALHHWSQADLARASGVKRPRISAYERGTVLPRTGTLIRLATAVRVPLEEARRALPSLRELLQAVSGSPDLGRRTRQAAEDAFQLEVEPFVAERLPVLAGRASEGEARRRAEVLVEELARLPPAERSRRVEEQEAYRSWAVCERTVFASARVAAHDADEALALARLAVRMAELTPGSAARRAHLGGLAWGFVANALRVKSDFPRAEEAFSRSDSLWEQGASGRPDLPLDGARLLDLKASLYRHQGQFQESLDLLDTALGLSRSPQTTLHLLLVKSATLEQMGDYQGAIKSLEQGRPLVERHGDLRIRCIYVFNLAASLLGAGRVREAEELLPRVRGLARQLGNGLDLLRTHWLQGRIAAAQGRLEEATAGLERVVSELSALDIPFDAARAGLDLCELYLGQGRTAEVRRLAEQMVEIFRAQRVHAEALAAVSLFRDAAEQEQVTAGLVQRLGRYLCRAQGHPGLRFEE